MGRSCNPPRAPMMLIPIPAMKSSACEARPAGDAGRGRRVFWYNPYMAPTATISSSKRVPIIEQVTGSELKGVDDHGQVAAHAPAKGKGKKADVDHLQYQRSEIKAQEQENLQGAVPGFFAPGGREEVAENEKAVDVDDGRCVETQCCQQDRSEARAG